MGSMNNQPSSFTPGAGGTAVPSTTWLLYNQPSYTVYDAQIGVSKDRWRVMAYGTNLSNSHASVFTTSGQFIEAEIPLRPRVLGVTIGWGF
jgi:hypothetical protein